MFPKERDQTSHGYHKSIAKRQPVVNACQALQGNLQSPQMLCSISVMYNLIWLSIFMYSSRALCTSCSICSLRSIIWAEMLAWSPQVYDTSQTHLLLRLLDSHSPLLHLIAPVSALCRKLFVDDPQILHLLVRIGRLPLCV